MSEVLFFFSMGRRFLRTPTEAGDVGETSMLSTTASSHSSSGEAADGKPWSGKVERQTVVGDDDVSQMSIDARMPKGPLYTSLAKIRGTINDYTGSVSVPQWYIQFRSATACALEKRLKNHEGEIEHQAFVEVTIACNQLRKRIAGLLHLHKKIKRWIDSNVPEKIMDAIPCFEEVGYGSRLPCHLGLTTPTPRPLGASRRRRK